MKVQSLSIVLVFGVIRIAEVVNGMCLVRSTSQPKVYGFQCIRSNDYLSDVKKAPIDIARLMFISSKIQVVRDHSFERLGKSLKTLSIANSGIEVIEDNAFRGLTELELLDLTRNKLEIIKGVWFKGLVNLFDLTFRNNRIKVIEDSFFTTVPDYLAFLDVAENEVTCLSATALASGFRVHSLHIRHNPLTWSCQALLMNWYDDMKFKINYHNRPRYMDIQGQPYDLATICAAKLPSKSNPDEEFLENCAERTTDEYLPVGGNYTVKQVCEIVKNKLYPFLDCTK